MKAKASVLLYCNSFSKRKEAIKLENEYYWTVEFGSDEYILLEDGTLKGNSVWKNLRWTNLGNEPLYHEVENLSYLIAQENTNQETKPL